MSQNEAVFRDAPVRKAVVQMAVPTVISSLVLVVYNMADTFFVGQTHDAYQVAAVSLTNPVFVMYMAIANMLGIGGSALISILLGQDRKEEAKSASSFCCWVSLLFGVLAAVLILVFMDPLFILVFDMGTAGAAIATVLGNVCGCFYYLYYFAKKSRMLSIHPGALRSAPSACARVLSLGIPAGINSGLMSVATVLLNNALVSYGDKPLAAMGIVTKAYMLIAFIHMGIANGIQPLLGYCYGAGLRKRFTGVLKFSAVLTIVCGTVLSAAYIFGSQSVVALFIDDAEVISYGSDMLIATSLAGPILGLLFLSINSMQALDRPLPATLLSVCRQGLFFIPLLYILDTLFGIDGINFTQAAADYLSIVISLLLLRHSLRALPPEGSPS